MGSPSLSQKRVVIHGHVSAQPEALAAVCGASYSAERSDDCDVAIFAINPAAGINPETIEMWQAYDELQTPRLVIVHALGGTELDFDDGVLLANRVFDQLVTPFLVLHGVDGEAIGLIELSTLNTLDYSTQPPTQGHADSELETLVNDFREEYFAQLEEMGDGAFAAGLLFPAIPVNLENELGVNIVKSYLDQLPSG